MTKQQAEAELIKIVTDEVTKYEKGQFWITDKVAFNMREMVKQFRKNYWGIYDDPKDPVTKQELIWIPLTRLLVDSVRKGVNRDPKDIRFRSKRKVSSITHLVRGYVRGKLSDWYFNHKLDQAVFTTAVDGTEVWKTYMVDGALKTKDVDLMNVYIDPTADSIQDAYRFTERVPMTSTEVRGMDWENTDKFATVDQLEKEDGNSAKKIGEYGDVYEMWGKIPGRLLTLNDEDTKDIDAHVVISGIDTGTVVFHLVEKNNHKDKEGNTIKPYEEAWYIKVPGCWYGVGIPWVVMQLQTWINTIVNMRIKKNTVAQLGLLKIRRGAGVTQQMLQNLTARGVIELNDPVNDLQNLEVTEAGKSSYDDEQVAKNWAQEVTAVFDVNLANLPASTSATGAAIQDQQSKSALTLVVESLEHFTQRWMDRHVLPHIPKMMKKDGYATVFNDFEDIKQIREHVIAYMAMQQLDEMEKSGIVPDEVSFTEELQRAERKLMKQGDLFFEILDDIIANQLDTEVFMTNSEIDVGVTVRNLLELRNGMPPDVFAEMTAEALDLLGLQVPQGLLQPQVQTPGMQPGMPGQTGQPAPDMTSLVADANTMSSEQR